MCRVNARLCFNQRSRYVLKPSKLLFFATFEAQFTLQYEASYWLNPHDRPGLETCLKALRCGDTLVVWKLDRLERDLGHLVSVVSGLADREVGLRVLDGQGAAIDTATASGRLVFGIFAALAEYERELIRERTRAGLAAARARGRKGGRKFALTKAQIRLAQAAMKNRDTSVTDLAAELGIKPVTVYRYVGPDGELREHGRLVLQA